MGQSVVLTGIVLNSMPIGEYDKRITLLTKERGKITAFARGARRPQSQLLAATNPFSFGEFEVFEGRSSYTVSKATISNYFWELTEDLERAYMGFYFLEFADYYCQENNDEKEMLKLLYQSLRALCSASYKKALVRAIFELKAMVINGEGPNMFSCVNCNSKEHLHIFSVKKGGMLCLNCKEDAFGRTILDDTRYTMQFIVTSSIQKLYSFSVSDEVLEELTQIMKEYLERYVHHTFNSVAFC